MGGVKHLLGCAAATGHVAVEAANAQGAEQFTQPLFQPLGALTEPGQIEIAAIGTGAWHRSLGSTVVTDQPIAGRALRARRRPMHDPIGVALVAAAKPATGRARKHRGVAAPIEKDQRLLATGNGVGDGLYRRLGEAMTQLGALQWYASHLGQRSATGALVQGGNTVAAAPRRLPGLK